MHRRSLLALSATTLAGPAIAQSGAARALKFVPNSDLTVLDPIFTAAFVTRLHGLMVYDTLYGQDEHFQVRPQMVEGHRIEDDGKLWRLTLRDGLRFHDGEPVLAKDVVASLKRWGRVDAFGQTLMSMTEELSAASDKEVRFRLKAPFPLLADALGKSTAFLPVIMPERHANTPNNRQVTEMVGSGPFRYVANERVDGVRSVYEKFAGYVPRSEGTTSFTAGPKIAHVGRIEWVTIPDDATAAAALRQGEIDWWERPQTDYLATLRRSRDITVEVIDRTGFMAIVRFNHLQPPFDNPAIRRAMLGAISQTDLMASVSGGDPSLADAKVGVFCPESAMANDAGLDVLTSPRDPARARRELAAAGYRGEPVVFLTPTNNQATNALSVVAADGLRQAGMNVDLVAVDFGAWLQRRTNREPSDRGGWNATATFLPGTDMWDPAGHLAIRGNGAQAWSGWPTSSRLEELRNTWFAASDEASRQGICRQIQEQVWQDVPYIPGGRWWQPTAYRKNLMGVLRGMPLFYNVRL
ncbi:MAG: Peptide/nickel transport system substrate-binding protein [Rubritepida sp.]|nr:Peptide/nickel transport system substrate-binding protein [Rubritepida sp.]